MKAEYYGTMILHIVKKEFNYMKSQSIYHIKIKAEPNYGLEGNPSGEIE